ncbi:Zinc finger RING-type [Penicillium cf. griseofulvum]|uniref:Zinc finger RING-type n=1 Tax=Penicillium cf. griseofulvum TaxID=2972120 RepID=A0A9W9J295_9EURO|nr:Zinc finger RING-type [Penicillium cf. griseofulvum]KAJ5451990.1 Zinc finger RING-type [Penicillium cf. griseofulvum]
MSSSKPSANLPLDPISEWRAWQTLTVIYTIQLNSQIRRRCLLEQECMQNLPITEHFRPLIFLEPVPTLHKPSPNPNPSKSPTNNPFNATTMDALRTKARLLRARVEKGKELGSEIERRMEQDPPVKFPTHFCHTCVQDGERVEVLLTKCGHRVCTTCLEFAGDGEGNYECSICFEHVEFVARSPPGLVKEFPEIPSLFKGRGSWDERMGGDLGMSEVMIPDC